MGVRVVVAPTTEPVTLIELKESLRVTHTDDDRVLTRLLAEGREFIEQRCQRELALKTWELTIDWFPSVEIMLPRFPLSSIASVKYDNPDGFLQTLAPEAYFLDKASEPGWLFPINGWPVTLDAINAVRVRFVAGYDDYALIPGAIKSAIVLKVQELYDGTDTAAAVNNLLTNHYLMVA